jgi:murein DD-endopeptidase MepM/ murein hydrolase activator NlpD
MTKRMRLSTAKKAGFSRKVVRPRKELPRQTVGYLKQKSSFLVAAFSLVAFISGNMIGQNGWYAFMKAALGQYDDSLITYTGTVTPIALVPDYTKWSTYGGNGEEHTFRQVPKDLLIPLPAYKQATEKKDYNHSPAGDVFSVGHMGSYETGAEGDGSHIGVDIRAPQGTPVRAIANGIVTRVANDASGFGLLIVIRHPHMPDPENPEYETVLHSNYAHLSAQYVSEGDVVKKGQEIGLTGKTGFATGPHLHFQIDRDTAPWHPYWAFSYTEAREAGMNTAQAINNGLGKERGYEYTVHPMLLVQSNYSAPKYQSKPGQTIAKKKTSVARASTPSRTRVATKSTMLSAREQRLADRLARRPTVVAVAQPVKKSSSSKSSIVPVAASSSSVAVVVHQETVASGNEAPPAAEPAPVLVTPQSTAEVASVEIDHDRYFEGRSWETVRITLLDAAGKPTTEAALKKDVYLRTAFGEAEFDPPVLKARDFKNGVATFKMLPRGRRTVVIQIEPYKSLSKPMEYDGE